MLTNLILFLAYAFTMLGSLKTVALFGSLTAVAIAGAVFRLVIFPIVERFDQEKGGDEQSKKGGLK